jgi:hypothetical protein
MKKTSWLRVFCVVVACVALGWSPKSAFAQRAGGHGGGGGSHGGGGGFHGSVGGFHSGGGSYALGGARYGGYYGRGYYGAHGAYYGHGGYWGGHPGDSPYRYGYGYGWGFAFGFGWRWPYYYPYSYGYSPWWYGPNYYPYYVPYGYSYPYNGDDPPPSGPGPKAHDNAPVKPPGALAPQSAPNTSARSASIAASMPTTPLYPIRGTTATASDYRPTHTPGQLPPARREVLDAIRVAREMPPYAFQRRIDSGRYNDFTREEQELVNMVAKFQLVWEKPQTAQRHRAGLLF